MKETLTRLLDRLGQTRCFASDSHRHKLAKRPLTWRYTRSEFA
jgi:hypothetical protein